MSNTLHVQVLGGLVSRMRAVVGAIACCEATGRRLIIDWPKPEPAITSFQATFHDLWSNDYEVTRGGVGLFTKNLTDLAKDCDIQLRTCHLTDFMPYYSKPLREYIAVLQPTEKVATFSAEALEKFRRPVVGIATRCTNNHPMMVDLGWFERRRDAIAKECDVQFYLSCDTKDAFDRLSAPYPDRCITQDKTYLYDRLGIMKSAADLYTLAACDWVIGTNHSSYSEMVALIRGAKLIGSHEKPDGTKGGRYEDAWNPSDPVEVLGR